MIATVMISTSERRPAPSSFATEHERWAAVLRRDPAADSVFCFSVRTTGVYCRPSCAARRPRRENVAFHPTWADAERAGFRPCKRCRPNEAPLATRHACGAGFNSTGRSYATSSGMLGKTPADYRAGGTRASIRFAVGRCSLGSILVAASTKGVCAISLGDDPEVLARDLHDRFPHARLIGGDPAFEQWVAKVVGFVEAPGIGLDLPLDIRGTAFQQRVWRALCDIPLGSTASYTQVAVAIGAPTAARAVARACAANPLAMAIPCHRVVRTDGTLSGYRWGIERKRALLDREA